jgi:hypothetical protein
MSTIPTSANRHLIRRAHKVARKLAKDAAYKALLAEDDTKVWYVKYARKAYRALMHGMDVDIHEVWGGCVGGQVGGWA